MRGCVAAAGYAVTALLSTLIVLARALKWALNAVRAARKLHNDLLDTVIRLPMAFFDSECTHP